MVFRKKIKQKFINDINDNMDWVPNQRQNN